MRLVGTPVITLPNLQALFCSELMNIFQNSYWIWFMDQKLLPTRAWHVDTPFQRLQEINSVNTGSTMAADLHAGCLCWAQLILHYESEPC